MQKTWHNSNMLPAMVNGITTAQPHNPDASLTCILHMMINWEALWVRNRHKYPAVKQKKQKKSKNKKQKKNKTKRNKTKHRNKSASAALNKY